METSVTVTEELVIRGDEVFKSETFLTPLGPMDQMIREAFVEDTYSFLPLTVPPMMSKWVTGHFLGTAPNGKDILCFNEVEYFPFKGGHLYKRDGQENHTLITPPQYRDSSSVRAHASYKEIDHLNWKIPTDYRGFVLTPFNERRLKIPYFFLIKRDYSEAVIPNIPNIYGSGKICTGDSYKNRNDADVHSSDNVPLHHIKHGLNILHEAPCNNDLREGADTEFMQWDAEGNSIVTAFDTTRSQIASQVTDVRIVEFFKWIRTNQEVLSS